MSKPAPDERLRQLLDTGRALSLTEIQKLLQIGERQARRIIRQLREGGLLVQEQREGRQKIFSLLPESQQVAVPDLRFDSRELRALTIAAKASRSVLVGTPHAEALGRAFDKLLERARPVTYLFDVEEPTQEWHFDYNEPDRIQMDIFRQLETAMDEHRSVRMDYLTAKDSRPSHGRKVDPYIFAKRNRAWMLVAYCHKRDKPLTFALTRISRVDPCDDATEDAFFTVAKSFNPETFFRSSLGAITSDHCYELRLLVEPDKATHFRERQYHPTQQINEERPDGRLVVSYELEGFEEMRSFCQGWGVGITVLEPAELRERLGQEAEELIRRYRSELSSAESKSAPLENWRLFWAKTNREKVEGLPDDWTHPLWAHLIDVGSAAQVLWDEFLPAALKKKMAEGVGMEEVEAGRFLSIWIGLHDLGKGIPGFQEMNAPAKERLESAGLHFHENPNRLHHGHASIAIAQRWLGDKGFERRNLLDALAAFVGIHHGKLCQSKVWEGVAKDERPEAVLGTPVWKQAQHDLTGAVFMAWGAAIPPSKDFPTLNSFKDPWPDWLLAFAGWATLADWLGSMQSCYDLHVRAEDNLQKYITSSREGAYRAYRQAGLDQRANLRALPFDQHFGNSPRPLQEIVADLPLHSEKPNLVIAEAPTGEGKTEAGFYLTARHGGGVYVAMPSQSTSDGLYPRLKTFVAGDIDNKLQAAHVGDTAALRLVHGNDLLHDDAVSLLNVAASTAEIDDNDGKTGQGASSGGQVLSWFMPKKRALLVPYGVGTVDQLFLGVLFAKHFFLRLFALCGKTVIFDEVHAYDAYMNTIFGQLLRWLNALDVNVVVLSATLPTEARQRMLDAWGSPEAANGPQPTPYPVVWHSAAGTTTVHPFAPAPGRGQKLSFRWCGAEIEAIVEIVKQLLAQGATVMVVCNTVKRAQEVFAMLDTDDLLPEADRMLLHARMPQSWRQQRERNARARFGPKRPARPGLLVGTQVIEQSLDLDVDALVTDLAPVDLLLQRAGRLHRHKRERPAGFVEPILYISCSESEEGQLPDVDEISGGGKIYAMALLWKTWAVLRQVGGWALPLGDEAGPGYRAMIETVYGDVQSVPNGLHEDFQTLYTEEVAEWIKLDKRQMADATGRLVPEPGKLRKLFVFEKPELAEEEESQGDLPKHLQALTRSPNGINAEVLLLYRTPKGWAVETEGETILYRPKHFKLSPDTLRTLFGAAVRISNPGIVSTLWKEENSEWVALQEEHRVLKRFQLIELVDGQAVVGKVGLTLDYRLGLIYSKL